MQTRYTESMLRADLGRLNATLAKHNHQFRLDWGHSYNRNTVDLATPEQVAKHCCHTRLTAGTARECLAASNAYVLREIA